MKKIIPNTITCCNLISGCIATTYAFTGDPKMALVWIIIGAIFDFFDGMSARLLNVSSPIGKELDSLADDITFGVAPSMIIFWQLSVLDDYSFLEPIHEFVPYFAFVMAAFSALRLAKFNLDERQSTSFIGMPTPANALFWGALIISGPSFLVNGSYAVFVILALVCISSYLLVCEIPMFALKFKQWGWKGNEIKYCFIGISILSFVIFTFMSGIQGLLEVWWFIIALYLLISVGLYLKKK